MNTGHQQPPLASATVLSFVDATRILMLSSSKVAAELLCRSFLAETLTLGDDFPRGHLEDNVRLAMAQKPYI